MSLEHQIRIDLVEAIRKNDSAKKEALRIVLSELTKEHEPVPDSRVLDVVREVIEKVKKQCDKKKLRLVSTLEAYLSELIPQL